MFTNPTSSKIFLAVAIVLGAGWAVETMQFHAYQDITALQETNAAARLEYANAETDRMEMRANATAEQLTRVATAFGADLNRERNRNAELNASLVKSHVALKNAAAALGKASGELAQQHRQLVAKR